jgi:negative regulator of flagellin synthesis FlgM
MKVNNTNNLNRIREKTEARTPKKASTEAASTPSAAQKSAQVDSSVAQALSDAKTSRAERLRDIEAAVRDGTYQPDPQKIAEQILADAEISAKLKNL